MAANIFGYDCKFSNMLANYFTIQITFFSRKVLAAYVTKDKKLVNWLLLTLMQMSCQDNEDQSVGDSQFILIVHTPLHTSLYNLLHTQCDS